MAGGPFDGPRSHAMRRAVPANFFAGCKDFAIKRPANGHRTGVANESRKYLRVVSAVIWAGCSSSNTRLHDDAALPDAVATDAPADAPAIDARPEVVADARPDAPPDAPPDAANDAANDARPDAVADAPPDAPPDAANDAPPDAPPDARPDAPPDARPDAANDASPDGPPPEFITVTLKFPPADRQRGVVVVTARPLDMHGLREFSCTETCQVQVGTGATIALQVTHVLGLPVTIAPIPYWTDLWQDTTIEIGSGLDPTSIHQWSDTTTCRRVAAFNNGEMLCVNDTLTKRDVHGEILWSRFEPTIDEVVVANDGSFLTADGRKWSAAGVVEWSVPVTSSRLRQIAIGPQNDVAMIDNTVDTHLHLFNASGAEMANIAPFLGRTFLAVRAAANGDWVALEQFHVGGFGYPHTWQFHRYSSAGVRLADFMQPVQLYFSEWYTEIYFAVVNQTVVWLVNNYNEYFAGQASPTRQLDLVSRDGSDPCRAYGVGQNPMMQPIVLAANCNHSTNGLFTTDGRINLYGYYYDTGFIDRRGMFPADAVVSPNGQYMALSGEFVNEPPTNEIYISYRNTPVTTVLKYPTP